MWEINESDDGVLGLAVWHEGSAAWKLDARGGAHGISVSVEDKKTEQCFQLKPADGEKLPVVAEQFVRGDELHLWLPQTDNGTFGVRLAFEPIHSDESCLVLEATISIQTNLLDTHPTLDICAAGGAQRSLNQADSSGSPPISIAERDTGSVAVLLGPHDSPFTTDVSTKDELALRLFGDFLEKGVIRIARPWFAITAQSPLPSDEKLNQWHSKLQESPLPLAP